MENNQKATLEEMKQWSAENFATYLCPEGTMTLEEFDNLLTTKIAELWNEKYGSDY